MRYRDVYPSAPAINSSDLARRAAADLLTLEYFEAEPGEMPTEVFTQHHILLNLNDQLHRVERAKERLVNRDDTLVEIALACGFSDQAHFSRVFKAATGKAPSAWRSQL